MRIQIIHATILLILLVPTSRTSHAYDPELVPKIEPPQSKPEVYLGQCYNARQNMEQQYVDGYKVILAELIDEIDAKLAFDSNNPYLWYLKGCSSLASLYVDDISSQEKEMLRKNMVTEFENSLKLNARKFRLKEYQLANIAGSASLTEQATNQRIQLRKKQGNLSKRLHRHLLLDYLIPSQMDQNKFDAVMKNMDFLDKNFPDSRDGKTGNLAWRKYLESEIAAKKKSLNVED